MYQPHFEQSDWSIHFARPISFIQRWSFTTQFMHREHAILQEVLKFIGQGHQDRAETKV